MGGRRFRRGENLGASFLAADKNDAVFNSPKRNNSRRSVKLAASAVEALRTHRERQLEEREKLDGLWQDHGLVFTSTIGTPLNRHNVFGRSFKPLLSKGASTYITDKS